MDLADYLSDLLLQHDEVSVPGLGYFTKEGKSAVYNDQDARFYPPFHQVNFYPQLKDDDVFTQYVADKKNISLASSKYFTEKFVNTLREQSQSGKYVFADIGFFQIDHGQLVFEPNEKIPSDPSFYGYAPIEIFKYIEPLTPLNTEHIIYPPPPSTIQAPEELVEVPQDINEDVGEVKKSHTLLVLILVIIIFILAIFTVLSFYPAAITRLKYEYLKITTSAPVTVLKYKPNPQPKKVKDKDTSAKPVVPLPAPSSQVVDLTDTFKSSRFELIAAKYRHPKKADAAIKMYKAKGLDSKLAAGIPGPLLKVSVGSYHNKEEAGKARAALIKAGKISLKSQIIEIKPQQ
jgi:hypothetical protein